MTTNKYSGLSKDEMYLISRAEFENQKLITTSFVRKLFTDKNKASKVLTYLTKKGRLVQLEKGKYLLVPIKAPNQEWAPNEYLVAKFLIGEVPYYFGYFTAYYYWGLTEQVPQTMYMLNTKKSYTKIIGSTRYKAVKINKAKYYGVMKITVESEEVNISDRERTLVDFVYNPIGTFGNLKATIKNSIEKIDINKFVDYLIQFPVMAVRKRAGYILEEAGVPAAKLKKLKESIGGAKGYVVIDPMKKSLKGKVNTGWRIIVNS